MDMRESTNESFFLLKRDTSRPCAFEATTSFMPWSVSIRNVPMSALLCRRSATLTSSLRRKRTRAHRLGGIMIRLTRNRRASSQINIPTVPIRKITLPNQARAVSEATRWISLMSLLIRETISPRVVPA